MPCGARANSSREFLHAEWDQVSADGTVSRSGLIALCLPIAWRECLFSSSRVTRSLVGLLTEWNHQRVRTDQIAESEHGSGTATCNAVFTSGSRRHPRSAQYMISSWLSSFGTPWTYDFPSHSPCLGDRALLPADAAFVAGRLHRARFYESGSNLQRLRAPYRSATLRVLIDEFRILQRLYLLPLPARAGLLPGRTRFVCVSTTHGGTARAIPRRGTRSERAVEAA